MSKELTRSSISGCEDLNLEKAENHDLGPSFWRSVFIIVTCTAAMVVNVCLHCYCVLRLF
jgi:hypothetical protein